MRVDLTIYQQTINSKDHGLSFLNNHPSILKIIDALFILISIFYIFTSWFYWRKDCQSILYPTFGLTTLVLFILLLKKQQNAHFAMRIRAISIASLLILIICISNSQSSKTICGISACSDSEHVQRQINKTIHSMENNHHTCSNIFNNNDCKYYQIYNIEQQLIYFYEDGFRNEDDDEDYNDDDDDNENDRYHHTKENQEEKNERGHHQKERTHETRMVEDNISLNERNQIIDESKNDQNSHHADSNTGKNQTEEKSHHQNNNYRDDDDDDEDNDGVKPAWVYFCNVYDQLSNNGPYCQSKFRGRHFFQNPELSVLEFLIFILAIMLAVTLYDIILTRKLQNQEQANHQQQEFNFQEGNNIKSGLLQNQQYSPSLIELNQIYPPQQYQQQQIISSQGRDERLDNDHDYNTELYHQSDNDVYYGKPLYPNQQNQMETPNTNLINSDSTNARLQNNSHNFYYNQTSKNNNNS